MNRSISAIFLFCVIVCQSLAIDYPIRLGTPPVGTTYIINPGDSIQLAVNLATDGDVILVQPGVYNETVDIVSGKDYITIRSIEPQGALVRGFNLKRGSFAIIIDGFEVTPDQVGGRAKIFLDSGGHTIINNYIHHANGSGVSMQFRLIESPPGVFTYSCHDVIIKNNLVYRNQNGIGVQGHRILVEGNEVRDLFDYTGHDVDFSRVGGDNIIYLNNFFHGPGGNHPDVGSAHVDAIQFFNIGGDNYIRDMLVEGNVFIGFDQGLIFENVKPGYSDRIIVYNNVFMDATAWMISLTSGTTNFHTSNNVFMFARVHGIGYRINSSGSVTDNVFLDMHKNTWWSDSSSSVTGSGNIYWNYDSFSPDSDAMGVQFNPMYPNPGIGQTYQEIRDSFTPSMFLEAGLKFDVSLPPSFPDPDIGPDPTSDPTSFPITVGPGDLFTILVDIDKPANAISAEVTFEAVDPDFPEEGTVSINGTDFFLFGTLASQDHDNKTVSLSYIFPVEVFSDGLNEFVFSHNDTQGYGINSVLVVFTQEQNPIPDIGVIGRAEYEAKVSELEARILANTSLSALLMDRISTLESDIAEIFGDISNLYDKIQDIDISNLLPRVDFEAFKAGLRSVLN